tara:strand:- start:49 stop:384 length:336 start_codon:yes stop_codon:yes gene_type:complete
MLVLDDDTTPVEVGKTKFDFNNIIIEGTNQGGIWFLQVWGDTGTGNFVDATLRTTVMFIIDTAGSNLQSVTSSYMGTGRLDVTMKVWIKVKVVGANAKTIDFFEGLHEYDV